MDIGNTVRKVENKYILLENQKTLSLDQMLLDAPPTLPSNKPTLELQSKLASQVLALFGMSDVDAKNA